MYSDVELLTRQILGSKIGIGIGIAVRVESNFCLHVFQILFYYVSRERA